MRSLKMLSYLIIGMALMVWAFTMFVLSIFFGPGIERNYFPVTSEITLAVTDEDEKGAYFVFGFDKYRECTFVRGSMLIIVGPTLRVTPVPDTSKPGQSVDLPSGKNFQSRVWIAYGLTAEQLENSHMIWRHQCHPYWESITDIYPQPSDQPHIG